MNKASVFKDLICTLVMLLFELLHCQQLQLFAHCKVKFKHRGYESKRSMFLQCQCLRQTCTRKRASGCRILRCGRNAFSSNISSWQHNPKCFFSGFLMSLCYSFTIYTRFDDVAKRVCSLNYICTLIYEFYLYDFHLVVYACRNV